MTEHHTADCDAGVEYRVMWWSEGLQRWFPHTLGATQSRSMAAAWLQQSRYRGGPDSAREPVLEVREVGPWTRVTASAMTGGGE